MGQNREEEPQTIASGVRNLIEARGFKPAEVADGLRGKRNRATFYRIMSGQTLDPRVGTLLEIVAVVGGGLDDFEDIVLGSPAFGYQARALLSEATNLLDERNQKIVLGGLRGGIVGMKSETHTVLRPAKPTRTR